MKSSRKGMKLSGLATDTFAALDAMEEKIRELGIGHDGAEDPVKGDSIANVCSTYMKKIRSRKEEQQKLRAEHILREFVAGTQTGNDNDRQGPVEDVERAKANHLLEQAAVLLKKERVDAQHVAELRLDEELRQQLRNEQIQKFRALDQNFEVTRGSSYGKGEKPAATCVLPPAIDCETMDIPKALNDKSVKRCSSPICTTEEYCRAIARGLVELTFCVSDNRFLDAKDISGRPVRRLAQDLSVTMWRAWVRKHLWGLDDEAGHTGPGCEHNLIDVTPLEENRFSLLEPQSPQASNLLREYGKNVAQEHLAFAAQQMGNHLSSIQAKAVEESLEGLRVEEERTRRSFIDNIRRRFDEAQQAAEDEGGLESKGIAADTVNNAAAGHSCTPSARRKEVLSGWMHRMPPAGCFVFGDDLSGVYLCVDSIDRVHTASTPSSFPIRRGSQAGGMAEDLSSSFSVHNTASPLGYTSLGFSKVEDGYQKIFLTPRVFQNAGRSPFTSRNRLGIANASNLKSTFRRTSLHIIEEEDRRELDTVIEQLCFELVNTHLHNLHVLTAGLVPPIRWTLGPPPQFKEQPHGNTPPVSPANGSSAPGDSVPPLRCLFLFNFPNSAPFYRSLQQRLKTVLESAELFVQGAIQRQHQSLSMNSNVVANPAPAPLLRGAGNYGATKTGTASIVTNHAALQRNKGGRNGSVRAKGIRNAASVAIVDSTARDDHGTTDGASIILPPLCVLGFFVKYDLPTRQRRLQEAYFHLPETCVRRNSDGTADTTSSSNTGCPFQQIYHNTFRPEFVPMGFSSKETNLASPMRAALPFAGSGTPQTAHSKGWSSNIATFSNAGTGCKKSRTVHMRDWSASIIRRELLSEDLSMKQWQEDWRNAFEPATSVVGLEPVVSATAPLTRGAGANPPHSYSKSSSKKKAASVSQILNEGGGTSTSLQAEHEKSSVTPQGAADGSEGSSNAEAAVTAVGFPRVLFFFRREEFNFSTAPFKHSTSTELNGTLLGESAKSPTSHSQEGVEERVRSCEYLMARIPETVRNLWVSGELFTNESLCPHQLPAPLRLSDYRLTPSVCGELVQAHRIQSTTCAAPLSPLRNAKNDVAAYIPTLEAEVAVFGCLMRFLTQLLHLLKDTVFLRLLCCEKVDERSKWGSTLTPGKTLGNSKTIYYSSVDRNFKEAQAMTKAIAEDYGQQLLTSCRVWLERQLLVVLETVAGGLEMMISDLRRQCKGNFATEKEFCVASSLIKMLPTLDGDKLDELIRHLMSAVTPFTAFDTFWSGLNEYFIDVETAAIECVLSCLTPEVEVEVRASDETLTSGDFPAELLKNMALTALVPPMVKELLARFFALPQEGRPTAQDSSSIDPCHCKRMQLYPYLARCGDLLCEVLLCFDMGMSCCLDWVQGMYQVAINKPSDGTCPILKRPRTVPDIFLPPPTPNTCELEQEKARSLSGLNAWAHLNMKLFITSFSIFGRSMLQENEFLYASVLTQLARIEHLLAGANHASDEPNCKDESREDGTAMATSCDYYWFDSFLLHAPCRAQATAPLTLLTLEEMQNLFQQASKVPNEEGIPLSLDKGEGEVSTFASARHFLTNLVLRRWCFCSKNDPEKRRCSYVPEWAVPEPTTRELRAAIMTLPTPLCCCQGTETVENPGVSVEAAWQSVRWWWMKLPTPHLDRGKTNEWVWTLENRDISLILLHVLRSDFVLTGEEAQRHAAYPPLQRVLKFMTRVAYSRMSTVERTFHTIAALRSRQQIGLRNTDRISINPVEGATPTLSAMVVDDLELNVETFCEFFSNVPKTSKVALSLPCDVRLMLQWEGAQAVTLPLLLSSHWGRLILACHDLG